MDSSTKLKIVMLSIFIIISSGQTADDDEVDTAIPGYPYKIYSGYFFLNVFKNAKAIHYVFFPSQYDQTNDPLIVWFTGGPGCSSLLAAFHQNGPFVFRPQNTSFEINKNSWNKKANLLYFQLPAGVGFSDGPEEQVTDQIFATDALASIRMFLARFPKFKKNQLYLTGHGYAGVYVTYLSRQIIYQNNDTVVYRDKLNLKGILLGNPCALKDECYASGSFKLSYYHYQFLYNRAFFTKTAWNNFRAACLLDYGGRECYLMRENLNKLFDATNTSMYNIYDKCYKTKKSSNYVNTGCEDNEGIMTYLNDKNVRQNWNIIVDKQWLPCNQTIFTQYRNSYDAYTIYPFLIKNNLRIWIYSGDIDSYIPIIGTKSWIERLRHQLDMPVRRIWREWWIPGKHKGEDQVGGFIWELRDLTFVSVKGAGFRTAYDQPQAMSEVLQGFLAGKTLPFKNK